MTKKGLRQNRVAALNISDLHTRIVPDQAVQTPPEDVDTNKRTSYLPLLSPCIREEASTPSSEQGSAQSQIPSTSTVRFAKQDMAPASQQQSESRKRSFEESPPVSPTNTSKKLSVEHCEPKANADGEPCNKRAKLPVVTLPNEIAHSLFTALGQSTLDLDNAEGRQYRAMSVPRNMQSNVTASTRAALVPPRIGGSASVANSSSSGAERRESVRAQQLALLASQARLASSGATSIGTALRAEKAMKGAVWKAVEGVQAARQARNSIAAGALTSATHARDTEEGAESASSSRTASPSKYTLSHDPTNAWSEVLTSPSVACSFLDSAKEVAHGWANGFYAYEKEWVDGALSKEKQRLTQERRATSEADAHFIRTPSSPPKSPTYVAPASSTEEDADDAKQRPRRKSFSEPPLATTDDIVEDVEEDTQQQQSASLSTHDRRDSVMIAPSSDPSSVTNAKRSLLAAQRRLSTAVTGNRGKLVDVLSNFASLIDSRKEGCHSLELLAHNARRLSAVQLPNVRQESLLAAVSPGKSSYNNIGRRDSNPFVVTDANSAASADSPHSTIIEPIG